MKFVALISGGKDSFYNIMHCMHNGHTLSALANLHPADEAVNELDSFMFQTIGHDVIDCYRQCVDESIPLYRRAITGRSSNVALEYEPTHDDEIEDLYQLLKDVKKQQPDIEAVSCGAILSHYQRTRVENVCGRLGLTSLAYLWQRDQAELMREMCASGLEAILVKVAAVGLTEKHLGKSISELYPILTKLNSIYDVHVCGEGGEFETLVLDAPFFKKKLQITDHKVIAHSPDVSFLSIRVSVVAKEQEPFSPESLIRPPVLAPEFERIIPDSLPPTCLPVIFPPEKIHDFMIRPHIIHFHDNLYIGSLSSKMSSVENQTQEILEYMQQCVVAHKYSMSQVYHITLLVSDMANFSKVNSVYQNFFEGIYLPPSRVCVETTLPAGSLVQISCTVSGSKFSKTGIHIRSRSYWASQNIGPYSQAIIDTRDSIKIATLSGQIPLVPETMDIDKGFSSGECAALSLQHLYRVKTLIRVRQLACCICYITEGTDPSLVSKIWSNFVSEVEHGQTLLESLVIVKVKALPKQAKIEWAGIAFEKVVDMYDDEDEVIESPSSLGRELVDPFQITQVQLGDKLFRKIIGNDLQALIDLLRSPLRQNSYMNVFADLETIHQLSNMGLLADWTPVLGVYNNEGERRNFGIIWIS